MRISDISIESFRGIPKTLSLSFCDKTGMPVSVILHGDNGSGKSSVIDALEFNLQARVNRSETITNPLRPSLSSLFYNGIHKSKTRVTLDNGNVIERNLEVVEIKTQKPPYVEKVIKKNNPIADINFFNVSLALRRNDIISLGMTPFESRQVFFLSFVYSTKGKDSGLLDEIKLKSDPYIIDLRQQIIKDKRQRDDLLKSLGNAMGVDRESLPNHESLSGYVNNRLFDVTVIKQCDIKRKPKYPKKQQSYIIDLKDQILVISDIIHKKQDEIKDLTHSDTKIKISRIERNNQFLKESSAYLTESFKKVSEIEYIDKIELILSRMTNASMELIITLKNHVVTTPSKLFSEGNYDLLILLLYVSIIRVGAEKGQAKVLLMDDVLQSVDSTVRVRFMNYMLEVFKDWQLIITTHDRLWLNQLKFLFSQHSHKFKEIDFVDWSFDNGPKYYEIPMRRYDTSIDDAIKTNNYNLIASASGWMLEQICQNLSVELQVGITRKPLDKYTIGDMWPGIKKKLRQTNLKSLLEEIDSCLTIRNLLGCHYNEWAAQLSDRSVMNFANYVKDLYSKTFCSKCCSWIHKGTNYAIVAECNCHNVQYGRSSDEIEKNHLIG